jgi:hypothetical protein
MKTIQAKTANGDSASGRIFYSNMISKTAPGVIGKSIYVYQHASDQHRLFLVANANENERGRIVVFDEAGELLNSQLIAVYKGKNTIEVSTKSSELPPHLIAVYLENQLAYMQKLV